MTTPEQVLSDFIDAWNAGRRPRVPEYLQRVPEGAQRDELADRISTWLEIARTPAYDERAAEQIRSEPAVAAVFAAADAGAGAWPQLLPELRARRSLSLRVLADRVVERFGLRAQERPRAEEYLERLEAGELEPGRVSQRLLGALAEVLGVDPGALGAAGRLGPRPAGAGGVLFRRTVADQAAPSYDVEAVSRAAFAPAPEAMDELDRLFLGGPDA